MRPPSLIAPLTRAAPHSEVSAAAIAQPHASSVGPLQPKITSIAIFGVTLHLKHFQNSVIMMLMTFTVIVSDSAHCNLQRNFSSTKTY